MFCVYVCVYFTISSNSSVSCLLRNSLNSFFNTFISHFSLYLQFKYVHWFKSMLAVVVVVPVVVHNPEYML